MTKDDLIHLLTEGHLADVPGDALILGEIAGKRSLLGENAEQVMFDERDGEIYASEQHRANSGYADMYDDAPETAVPAIILADIL